eukprot:scpid3584/ scgid4150/ Adenylate kinase domain-containing protein 1; Adenylate kinase domain-containing protein 2
MDDTVSDTNTPAEAAGLLDDSADSKKSDKTTAVMDTGKKTREFVDGTVADLVELEALQSTPTCFLVIGKPGIGKSSLASRVAKSWGCVHVNVRNSILQAIAEESDIGKKVLVAKWVYMCLQYSRKEFPARLHCHWLYSTH